MLDLSFGKVLVIALVALFLVGPDKLPAYAVKLAQWVRVARGMLDQAKSRMAAELGPEFEDVDWANLDPRRYHPRRLLMDAWNAPQDHVQPHDAGPDREPVVIPAHGAEPDLLALEQEHPHTARPEARVG